MIGTVEYSEKEYRDVKLNSYSSLKDFSVDRRKYYRRHILGETIKEKDTQASNMGRLVETLLMEPDRFDDLFFMSSCVKIPGGMLGDFIYFLSEIISENTDDDGVLDGDFEDHAKEAYTKSGFKLAFASVLKKLDDPEKQRLEGHLRIVLEKSRSIRKDELEQLKKDFGPKRERLEVDMDELEDIGEEDE